MKLQQCCYGISHTVAKPIIKALQNPILPISNCELYIQLLQTYVLLCVQIYLVSFTHIKMQKHLIAFIIFSLFVLSNCFFVTNQQSPDTNVGLSNKTKLLWPMPTRISFDEEAQALQVNPCNINYAIEANPQDYIKQILNLYLIDVFKCKQLKPGSIKLRIVVKNANQMISEQTAHEKYSITIRTSNTWDLTADYYVGFLRGLETFSQLFEKHNETHVINGRPIQIDDSPNYVWRGLMIDTSRHFLSTQAIKHTIDALMFNKMSILHWHIIDQDSFPMEIQSRPELSEYGKLSGTYSRAQIKSIVNYAKIRGVRVIPQFDTPAHTESWGRSIKYRDIVVRCDKQYQGQFDPTLNLTYEVVTDVMKEINNTFIDSYAHFGGDQIEEDCYTQKPSIKQWMDNNNISTYLQLSNYYRKRQKSIWRTVSPFKKAIYWANEAIDMPVEADDVIHWWGVAKNVNKLAGRKNEVILSNYDVTYLDLGYGGRRGGGYGTHISWRDLYNNFDPKVKDVNVIGAETCMWSEISNEQVQDQKVWIRTSVLNQRLWNVNINGTKQILNVVERLTAHSKRLKERGFKVSPVTVGLCEKDASICFGKG